MRRRGRAAAAVAIVLGGRLIAQANTPEDPDLSATLARVAARIEQYFDQARRLLATESVLIQPVQHDLSSSGFPRRLVYDLRVEWDASLRSEPGAARVLRRLVTANGRPPRAGDEPKCHDPGAATDEPLTMLLEPERSSFTFTLGGVARLSGRDVVAINFRPRHVPSTAFAEGTWVGDCASVTIDGRYRGRLLIDPDSHDVLRLERYLIGLVDLPTQPGSPRGHGRVLERWNQIIAYREEAFTDPDERMMVPTSVETVSIFRPSSIQSVRTTQTLSGYRRFIAESRLVK